MKKLIPFAVVLLVGVVLGAAGVRALCDRGYCVYRSGGTGQVAATRTAEVFGAGSPGGALTTPVASADAACADVSLAANPAIATTSGPAGIAPITGLAIIGDSSHDEYRADNPRGGEYGATTFNWVELLAGQREVNLGRWGSRVEPRRGGYEFNWARSGATSATMIGDRQHIGVAEQIRRGRVSHVIIQIGINDFYYNDIAFQIYDGRLSGEELQQFLDGIVGNVELAVQTVKTAGNNRIILAATQDYLSLGVLPETQVVLPDATARQRLIDAFTYVNEGLCAVAAREQVPFFDFNAALRSELETRHDPADRSVILVGSERIDVSAKGDEPHHLFVGDDYAHPGTVLSGLIANLYIEQLNAVFGAQLAPFDDDEILRIAGIR
jgi:lysophospholipase L1-like esterase